MCDYNVITNNSFGCVVKCVSCHRLHVGFRSILTGFKREEFNAFCEKIERITEGEADSPPNEKIYIPTDSENFMIVLTTTELKKLNNLLADAQLMLEAHELIYSVSEK